MNKPMRIEPKPRSASAQEQEPVGDTLVRLFNDLRDELVGTLYYMLGHQEDALDAAQETFIKCWRNQDHLKDVQNWRAWIFRVAMNTATDLQRSAWRRRAKPLPEGDIMTLAHAASPHSALEEQEQMARLQAALHQLRDEEKEIFLLRQNGDLTYDEIAQQRNVPVGTVKTQMRSALQKLRVLMQ